MKKLNQKEISDILYRRYACKEFDKNKKIHEEDFNLILQALHLSPSSIGLEPWKFIIITNEDIKEKIAQESSGGKIQIQTCSHLVLICNLTPEMIKPNSNYINNHYKNRKYSIEQANLAMNSIQSQRLKNNELLINGYCREQCFIAIGNASLCASMLDIDSCIIGGFYAKGLKKILESYMSISDIDIACLMAFGYAQKEPSFKKDRKPYDETFKWLR